MMKAFALLTAPALVAAHGNMLYPPAWWDANGTSEHALLLQKGRFWHAPQRPLALA